MDRREEETEDGEIQSNLGKFFELFPLDLTPDLLLRLPAKSAVRFRGVSKLWSSLTTRPDFIRSFATQSSTRPCLLVSFITKDKRRCFISLSQHEHPDPDTCCPHVERFQIQSPEVDYSPPTSKSVHGLICFVNHGYVDRVVVWNPTMRQVVLLPDPGVTFKSCFLGYDPVEDKHKVLCISGRLNRHDPQVFTLGAQESWRVTQNSPLHFLAPSHEPLGLCINGHVYYKARTDDTSEDGKIIMSFDVRYEKFNTIRSPAANPNNRGFLLNYQGKLALFCCDVTSLRFWVLENEEKQEWSYKTFLFPFPVYPLRDPGWDVKLRLKGVTQDTGEFIFAGQSFEAIYVLYYDPKRDRTRRVKYEGFRDNEFRNRDDFTNNVKSDVHWFPNHNESLTNLENLPRALFPPKIYLNRFLLMS